MENSIKQYIIKDESELTVEWLQNILNLNNINSKVKNL